MKRKKISAIVKYFYPVTAGIETNMLETYSSLAKSWDISIHTSRDTYDRKDFLKRNEKMRGMNIHRKSWGVFGFWPDVDWKHANIVALHNFNFFPHLQILLYSLVLKIFRKKNFKVVLTPHGGASLDLAWEVFPFWQRLIKKSYNKLVAVPLINYSVDAIRAVSEWEKEDLVKKGVKKDLVEVISNGLEDDAYRNIDKLASTEIKRTVESWGDYIIQVGRVYPIKNYETTIKALAGLPKSIRFVIVGPIEANQHKNYIDNLKNLSKKLGVEDRVIFAGVLRGIDKYYAIRHAKMMVHMAIWESFCNVVHEGMSQGLPCVVANNTALPLLIKDGVNGYCVETRDPKTLRKKINFILENQDSKLVKDMREANIRFGKEESWKNVAKKMDKLYKSLL